MYSIKGDGITIYNDVYSADGVKAISPKLKLADNTAGALEITIPPGNAGYESLKRLSSEIIVYRKDFGVDAELWSGRILSEKKDFLNNRILTCEGALSYLNDTTQPQKEYKNLSVRAFLETILAFHNSKVAPHKRFTVGAVDVPVPSETENALRLTSDESTLTVIFDRLVNRLGGHLRIRKVNGVRLLDYIKDWAQTNPQEIRFGENLMDFTRAWDQSDFFTVIKPRGARLTVPPDGFPEGLEAYVDVTSVNAGSPYITNEAGITQWGWKEGVVTWDDVTSPAELKTRAEKYLTDQQFDNMVIALSAVDMRYLGKSDDSIDLLDQVRCISRPHNMNRLFPVSELSIQLDKPDASNYILGDLVGQNTTGASSNTTGNGGLSAQLANQPSANSILTEARENATAILNQGTRGIVTIVRNRQGSEYIAISRDNSYDPNTDLWSTQTKLWRWNIDGLGFSKDGGRTFGALAITNDGAIVANAITTGTMSADRIRGGILESSDTGKNLVFNMVTGVFTMKKGIITLGGTSVSPNFQVDNNGYLRAVNGNIAGFTIDSWAIYNDSVQMDGYGIEFRIENDVLGRYGTQHWELEPSKKGMSTSMETDTSYITWAYMENYSDDAYTIKLMYAAESLLKGEGGKFAADRVHLGCPLDLNTWRIYNAWIDDSTGGAWNGVSQTISLMAAGGGTYNLRFKNGFLVGG